MKTAKLFLMGLLVASGFVLSPSVYAQTSTAGFYAGLGAGQSSAKNICDPFALPGVSCDDTDTAWRIFGGYHFHENFGVELGYADLGKSEARGPGGTATWEATAWDLVAVGIIPGGESFFSLFGKAGIARWDVDATLNTPPIVVGSVSDNGTDFTYGFGAQFIFTKNVGARVEWQRYNDVGDPTTTLQSDVDVISASVLFMF